MSLSYKKFFTGLTIYYKLFTLSNNFYKDKKMLDLIVDFLQLANVKQVAKSAGLSYPTVLNIKNGRNKHPNLRTIQKLSVFVSACSSTEKFDR
jgi:hypothetical protein